VDDAKWLEVSLTVDGELAEAVAEVLDRFVSNGVVIESGFIQKNDENGGTPTGPMRVFGYLFIDEHTEEKRKRIEEALWHLGQIQPVPEVQYKTIADQDWMKAWKKYYTPLKVGKKLMIVPAWMEAKDPTRIAIKINPGMAFGTGTHPSTQLCLEHLENHVAAGQPLIDIGCGSGILSIAAIKMGASHAVAVDIDNAAVKNTEINAQINGVSEKMEIGLGSVAEVSGLSYSINQAPLVVVNILAPVIIRMLNEELPSLIAKGGKLILAGILDSQIDSVDYEARKFGFKLIEQRKKNDWVSPIYQK
jgi:ribosomal protein L11 methyltransferase